MRGGDTMRELHKLCLWRTTTRFSAVAFFSVLLVLFTSPTAVFADTTLFFDDFEDTTLGAWLVQPEGSWTNGLSNAHSGTRKARVAGNVENATLQRSVSTAGNTDIVLSFWHDTSAGWDSQDLLELQWTPDGGATWNTVVTLDGDDLTPMVEGGEDWIEHTHTLPANAANNSGFGIRFVATITGTTDIIFVDDVRVSGTATGGGQPTPTPTSGVTVTPTATPTVQPTASPTPTVQPTATPTPKVTPTVQPTVHATPTPQQPQSNPLENVSVFTLFVMLIRLLFANIFSFLLHF